MSFAKKQIREVAISGLEKRMKQHSDLFANLRLEIYYLNQKLVASLGDNSMPTPSNFEAMVDAIADGIVAILYLQGQETIHRQLISVMPEWGMADVAVSWWEELDRVKSGLPYLQDQMLAPISDAEVRQQFWIYASWAYGDSTTKRLQDEYQSSFEFWAACL